MFRLIIALTVSNTVHHSPHNHTQEEQEAMMVDADAAADDRTTASRAFTRRRRPGRRRRRRPAAIPPSPVLLLFFLSAVWASLTVPTGPSVAPSVFYDAFSTRIFDPAGRVLQLEYALETTRKGGAAVGAVAADLVCLASWTPRFSRRMAPAAQQPALGIWQGDAHVALAASGMATDALALVESARRECQAHRYIYDSPMNVGRLVGKLARAVHETERARIVPYAVDLLVAGYDEGVGMGPCLYKIGPAGIYGSYRAYAVGREAEKARQHLQARLSGGESQSSGGMAGLERLVSTVLKALMLTVPPDTPASDDTGASDAGQGTVSEDVSLVVMGKGLPLTRLVVVWEPRRRRLEVRMPVALVAALGGKQVDGGRT